MSEEKTLENMIRALRRDGFDLLIRRRASNSEVWLLPPGDKGFSGRVAGRYGRLLATVLLKVAMELGLPVDGEMGDSGLAARAIALSRVDRRLFARWQATLRRQGVNPADAAWQALTTLKVLDGPRPPLDAAVELAI